MHSRKKTSHRDRQRSKRLREEWETAEAEAEEEDQEEGSEAEGADTEEDEDEVVSPSLGKKLRARPRYVRTRPLRGSRERERGTGRGASPGVTGRIKIPPEQWSQGEVLDFYGRTGKERSPSLKSREGRVREREPEGPRMEDGQEPEPEAQAEAFAEEPYRGEAPQESVPAVRPEGWGEEVFRRPGELPEGLESLLGREETLSLGGLREPFPEAGYMSEFAATWEGEGAYPTVIGSWEASVAPEAGEMEGIGEEGEFIPPGQPSFPGPEERPWETSPYPDPLNPGPQPGGGFYPGGGEELGW